MGEQRQGSHGDVRLTQFSLAGFRSIKESELSLAQITVLIGPNGAGKSNLIGFFRMLSFMLSSDMGLSTFVGLAGGASTLLHGGPKRTNEISAHVQLETHLGINDYKFRLGHTANDTLVFLDERCRFSTRGTGRNPKWIQLGAGHRAPHLLDPPGDAAKKTQKTILRLLRTVHVYHFHDTSRSAPIKQHALVTDDRYLHEDGGNLAPFLLRLRRDEPPFYRRIIETIRLVAPFFGDFVLEPIRDRILLRWLQADSDVVFGPNQMSDGTLRAISLITLLLQPPELAPSLVIIDEPELGLHPSAVKIIAGLLRATSISRQCIAATQSPQFLDEFDPHEVLVAERSDGASAFQRLSAERLANWLEEYSLSDLWHMNILGGKPRSIAAE